MIVNRDGALYEKTTVGNKTERFIYASCIRNSANIQTTFSPTLYLQTNRDYELAMVNLETYFHSQIFEKTTIRSNGVLMRARIGQFSTYQLDVMN